jgi:hypothetical protein
MFVVLPLADISSLSAEGRGLSEDTWDTLLMIGNRPLLQILLVVYMGSLQAYNICGMVTAGTVRGRRGGPGGGGTASRYVV